MLLDPWKYDGLENVATVYFLVGFDSLIYESNMNLAAGVNFVLDHGKCGF